ncbi:DUF2778 domain-containing protein [Acetobacter sacchari]|uniref:DUF2778 domain-containing protein n=1 Tax=Acetobacter sacchari TaxID=2661687 RepID=A0ABS3LZG0_9PROT|nr:DUF2778 domain-containing protein [Acetobacter sacchari]MBO1361290.1 DUF2778 domain-containing protein [Acetobacter sacchari]
MADTGLPPPVCSFILNGRPLGTLICDGQSYAAFSGNGKGQDNPAMTNVPEIGAIPKGRYYIVDRPTGGRLGWLRDALHNIANSSDNTYWFALWADDKQIDDWTYIEGVKRGNFRLHPIGTTGRSDGCITLSNPATFTPLRERLLKSKEVTIPGTSVRYYGTVIVR